MQGGRIGLTGGIGSGKSTLARKLADLGAHVVDADALARRLTLPGGAAIEPLRQRFGAAAITPDGALDRDWMRQQAFSDPAVRQALEAVLHPLIGEHTQAEAALAAPGQVLVFDVPLLVESAHWRSRVDRVLVVDCSPQTQIDRVCARSGWSADQVRQVIAQQASRGQRRAAADAVIVNDGIALTSLHEHLGALWAAGFFHVGRQGAM